MSTASSHSSSSCLFPIPPILAEGVFAGARIHLWGGWALEKPLCIHASTHESCRQLYLHSGNATGAAYQGGAAPEVCLLRMETHYQLIYYCCMYLRRVVTAQYHPGDASPCLRCNNMQRGVGWRLSTLVYGCVATPEPVHCCFTGGVCVWS